METLMKALERLLALAFIVAVCLNFANVIGRYGFGRSILGADEVQVYIMVWMAFLGAAVVSWHKEHLRMDVLQRFLPEPLQRALKVFELALVLGLAGFTLVHSWRYVEQMVLLERKSDVAAIPMWLPHSAVAAGFALITLIALWQLLKGAKQP
jgi:TRAP-type transport system small permease protein